jgi:PilZ domain
MAEKRSHVRYAIKADIKLKTEEGASYSFKTGVSNISFRGVRIFSQDRIELVNKVVHFELMTDLSKEPLIGKGIIRYIVKEEQKLGPPVFRMGLEFVDINKGTILHFLNKIQEMRSSKIKRAPRLKKATCAFFGPL